MLNGHKQVLHLHLGPPSPKTAVAAGKRKSGNTTRFIKKPKADPALDAALKETPETTAE